MSPTHKTLYKSEHVIYSFYGNQARYCQSSDKMSATNT